MRRCKKTTHGQIRGQESHQRDEKFFALCVTHHAASSGEQQLEQAFLLTQMRSHILLSHIIIPIYFEEKLPYQYPGLRQRTIIL